VELLEDTLEGLRKIRLKEFWFDEEVPTLIPTKPKFYKKNCWQSPSGRDEALDAYCATLDAYGATVDAYCATLDAYCATVVSRVKAHIPKSPQRRNISKDSRKALAELKDLVTQHQQGFTQSPR
jgi:hypothetical protein